MFLEIADTFHDYMGSGLLVLWFLCCIIYLFLFEKKKERRILFVYMPVTLLILFFNPLFRRLMLVFLDREIYYRFLWLLPVTIVIAYTAVELYGKLRGKLRYFYVVGVLIVILVSGKLIYRNIYFHLAENIYHMPQSVVDICDAIEYEGREVMAAFPAEMIPFVRQYNGTVCMPYGREIFVETMLFPPLYYLMEETEAVEAAELSKEARNLQCVYLIVSDKKKITGSMETCDFEMFAKMDGYIVYKDRTVNLSY